LELLSGENAEEQLAIAESELLEARSTYTVRRKAVHMILMTDPILKAVHLKATTPAERYVTPCKSPASYPGVLSRITGRFFVW
jgi:hypothetical protein